jgi:hypothetical protein
LVVCLKYFASWVINHCRFCKGLSFHKPATSPSLWSNNSKVIFHLSLQFQI